MLNDSKQRAEARFQQTKSANVRQHSRYAVELDVHVGSEHNFYAGLAENMSAGGIFIATHNLKECGEVLEFSINLPGFDEPIRGVGEVRWVRVFREDSNIPPGLGLSFVKLEEGAEEMIEAFLKNRDPLFYDDD